MTLLDVLIKGAAAAAGLRSYLVSIGTQYPDLAPKANEFVALLDSSVASSNLVAIAEALPSEIANISHGNIHPRRHPSDAA